MSNPGTDSEYGLDAAQIDLDRLCAGGGAAAHGHLHLQLLHLARQASGFLLKPGRGIGSLFVADAQRRDELLQCLAP